MPASTIRLVTSVSPEAETLLAELEGSNRLLVQQVFKPIANEYRISAPAPGSGHGTGPRELTPPIT